MPLVVADFGAGDSLEPVATAHEISFALVDSGGADALNITTGLPAPSNLFDVPTFFGPNFQGIPWMLFFNRTFDDDTEAAREFWRLYSVTMYPLLGTTATPPSLTVRPLNGGKPNIEFTSVGGGEGANYWRVEIRFRHTLSR